MSQVNETGTPRGLSVSGSAAPASDSGPDWERFCKELLAEREKIRAELQQAKHERDLYRKALQVALPVEDIPFLKEDVLGQRGKVPSLHQLISDLGKELSR